MRGFIESAKPASGLRIGETLTRMPRTPSALSSASSLSLGLAFVEIDDAAAERRIELAHGVEHAGIVEAVGARLHEDVAHEAKAARQLQISLQRLVGRLVADVGAVGVFSAGPNTWKCASQALAGAAKAGS